MSLFAITTLILGNLAWAFAVLSVLMTGPQVNALVGWTGISVESPTAYLPLFLILALGFQIILFYLVSKMGERKKSLSERVRETTSENRTLSEQSKQKDRAIASQAASLEKTKTELSRMREKNPKEPWWKKVLP